MKDICPFCELPEPVADEMVFEVGEQNFKAECHRCPHCQRRYYTTGQVRKLLELVSDSETKKTNSKKVERQKFARSALAAVS
jgi:uncharacterized protein with PIN domain